MFLQNDFHYFTKIAELGSLAQAAQVLKIDQTALSRSLQRLEAKLEDKLFFREPRGVRLTAFGQQMFLIVKNGQMDLMNKYNVLKNENLVVSGSVKLGCHLALSLNYLPYFAPHIIENYPQMNFQIIIKSSFEAAQMVSNGELDFALTFNPPHLPRLVQKYLLSEDVGIYKNRLNRQLARKDILFYNPELNLPNSVLKKYKAMNLQFVPSFDLIGRFLSLNTHAFGLLPSGVTRRYPDLVLEKEVAAKFLNLYLVYREDVPKNVTFKAVYDSVQKGLSSL